MFIGATAGINDDSIVSDELNDKFFSLVYEKIYDNYNNNSSIFDLGLRYIIAGVILIFTGIVFLGIMIGQYFPYLKILDVFFVLIFIVFITWYLFSPLINKKDRIDAEKVISN